MPQVEFDVSILGLWLGGFRKAEHSRIARAREEPDEFAVAGPSDPVIDATIPRAEIRRTLEEHHAAGLPALHRDRVLVGAAAVPGERGLPAGLGLHDRGVEFGAELFRRVGAFRGVV